MFPTLKGGVGRLPWMSSKSALHQHWGASRPSTVDLISTHTRQLGQVNSDEAWPGVQVHVANMYAYVTHTTFHHYLAKAYHDSCSLQRQHRRDEDKYLLLGAVDA
jgi:hypothetical protein